MYLFNTSNIFMLLAIATSVWHTFFHTLSNYNSLVNSVKGVAYLKVYMKDINSRQGLISDGLSAL